jgi:hypothetical protein
MPDKKHWIAGAIKHPGSFTKSAKAHGMSTHAFAEKEKGASGKVGKRARLALILSKMH